MRGNQFSSAIAGNFYDKLLELSLEDVPLTKDYIKIITSSNCLKSLKNLRLTQIDDVDDIVVQNILSQCGVNFEGLHLSHIESIRKQIPINHSNKRIIFY